MSHASNKSDKSEGGKSEKSSKTGDAYNTNLTAELEEKLEEFCKISVDMFLQPLQMYTPDEYRPIVRPLYHFYPPGLFRIIMIRFETKELIDSSVECRFVGLWKNGAFSDSLDFIQSWDDKMLTSQSFLLLWEFLLVLSI